MTSSVPVQGSNLVGCHDLVMGDSGGEPGRVVVRSRCCHFCCHLPAGRRWMPPEAARPNRISSSGHGRPDRFKLDHPSRPVFPGWCRIVVNCNPNCNPQIRSSGQAVQDRPGVSALLADDPGLSVRERCRLAAWQQCWLQSSASRPSSPRTNAPLGVWPSSQLVPLQATFARSTSNPSQCGPRR